MPVKNTGVELLGAGMTLGMALPGMGSCSPAVPGLMAGGKDAPKQAAGQERCSVTARCDNCRGTRLWLCWDFSAEDPKEQ